MSCETINFIKIRQGSLESIKVTLTDLAKGERLDLTPFNEGKAKFINSQGVVIEKVLVIPGVDPKLGVVSFNLGSVDTAQFDKDMKDFEIRLGYDADDNEEIFTLRNSMEVEEQLS